MPTPTTSLTVRKLLPCPPAQAFEAWTDPKQFETWFQPESGMRVKAKIDLRVGGKYRLTFKAGDGSFTTFSEGEYLVVNPPHQVSYTWLWHRDDIHDEGGDTVVTIDFKAVGKNRTEVVLKHERFTSVEERKNHTEGWTSILQHLAKAMKARAGAKSKTAPVKKLRKPAK